MGFRDIEHFNVALLARQAWRLLKNPDSLWVRVLKSKYFKNEECVNAKCGKNPSWAWKSLTKGLEMLKKGMRNNINNGKGTRIWEDSWLPNNPNFKVSTTTPAEVNKPWFVADLIDYENRRWNHEMLNRWLNLEDKKQISKIAIGNREKDDEIVWNYTRDGVYYAKLGYFFILDNLKKAENLSTSSTGIAENEEGWKQVWNLEAMPNVKNFVWKSCNNALATKENISNIFKHNDNLCGRCGMGVESIEHILFFCDYARACWAASGFSYKPKAEGFKSLKLWWDSLVDITPNFRSFSSLSLIAYLTFQIWKERNDQVFEGKSNDPITTWNIAISNFTKFQVQLEKRKRNIMVDSAVVCNAVMEGWCPPGEGYIKYNCDASKNVNNGDFGIVAVGRNQNGEIVDVAAECIQAISIEAAEAMAIRMAMMQALKSNNLVTIIESDYKFVVSRLKNGATGRNWETEAIEKDILLLAEEFIFIKFVFVRRNCNALAYKGAKKARYDPNLVDWLGKIEL